MVHQWRCGELVLSGDKPAEEVLRGKIAGSSKLFMVPCCSCYIYGTCRGKEFGKVRRF